MSQLQNCNVMCTKNGSYCENEKKREKKSGGRGMCTNKGADQLHTVAKYEPHHKKTCFFICNLMFVDQLHSNYAADQGLCLS